MNRAVASYSYIPHTPEDQQHMLSFLGVADIEALFADIPTQVRLQRPLALPRSMSEIELDRHLHALASRNIDMSRVISFLGAGSYEHYQPSVVEAVTGRSEFYTSYTPYQPEVSQGMLQAIFEYQSMVAELTGMDLANASMYDGPTALGEAAMVAAAVTGRSRVVVSRTMHPEYRMVLQTYADGQSIEVVEVPQVDGRIDMAALATVCDTSVAAVLIQYPNFFGGIEDLAHISAMAHTAGALVVVNAYPIALGLLESPGRLGADIVVAEGQSLGIGQQYGGPYLGIMAARSELMRKLPGRMVGQTVDGQGQRGFVLTLQAREQHIRREKASSNICSNQALMALAATVFMSYMGPQGLKDLALQNFHKAHYLWDRLSNIEGVQMGSLAPFFNEFVVRLRRPIPEIQTAMLNKGFFFGLALEPFYAEWSDAVLLTVTEMRTREEMDAMIAALEELL